MAEEISMNTAVLLAQLESIYNTSPDALAAADAVLIKNMTAVPLTGDRKERNLVRPYYGANPGKLAKQHGTMQFTTEAAGAGVTALDAGTAPAFGKLLRAAGCAQTTIAPAATIAASPPTGVGGPTGAFTYAAADPYEGIVDRLVTLTCTTGGASATAEFTVAAPAVFHLAAYNQTGVVMTDAAPFALPGGATITPTVGTPFDIGDEFTIQLRAPGTLYTPVSTGFESIEAFFQYGPNRHRFGGIRGNVTLNAPADDYFDMTFDMMGLPGTRSSEALPTVDFSAFQDPLLVSDDNSPFVSFGGYEVAYRSFNFNVGQNTAIRSLVGQKKARQNGRSGSGTLVFEALDLATVDFFTSLSDGDYLPFELIHGLTRGEIVQLSMPRLQLTAAPYQDEEGAAMFSMSVVAVPSDAGNDEFTLAIK